MSRHIDGTDDGDGPSDATPTPGNGVTTTRIAPETVASDIKDCSGRTRRERPQRLKLPEGTEGGNPTRFADQTFANEHEPDIESFVAGCIPGVSFSAGADEEAPRRAKPVRKRPLPLLSFLSSTTLAGAEKKRRNEEATKQKLQAEEEARKALRLNPIDGTGESGGDTMVAVGEKAPPRVVITREQTSNILAPPLLREYLKGLEKPPVTKSG